MTSSQRSSAGLLLFSAATLVFEINLTRLFSVAQFYHFAFIIVSLALLGYGASGTLLALAPGLGREQARPPDRGTGGLTLAGGLSCLGAYLLVNGLPFDSFSAAWDGRQALIFTLHYLALAAPFFFNGLVVGMRLAAAPQAAGQTYAVNLLGSALGCIVALLVPSALGGEGTAVLSSALAALAALITPTGRPPFPGPFPRSGVLGPRPVRILGTGLLLLGVLDAGVRLAGQPAACLELRLSPYKSIAYALQYPGAEIVYQRWNAFSRVDVVRSPGVRSLPGLSYRYLRPLPAQDAVLIDGDDPSPLILPGADTGFADYLPAAIAFRLRPGAETLVLEPRGGLDVLTALALGARRVTAVEANPLVVDAAPQVYGLPQVRTVVESERSYLRRARESYDVIVFSLTSTYHPVRSGAYSLAEDYRHTVEAFQDALARLRPDGVLVMSRWLQLPPSEELRAFALAVTALEGTGADPGPRLVAFRGYNLGTLLVRREPFTPEELRAVRAFAAERAYDLIYAPDLRPEEVNQYNVLPEPAYSDAFAALLSARPRRAWLDAYPFEVSPPTDDHPFFGHFFKWSQAGQVMAELGKTWQPFGGAGYFVLVALLGLVMVLAGGLILLPLVLARIPGRGAGPTLRLSALGYFGSIGLGFMLIELPLIQRFILFLDHPSYALSAVLFSLLLFSSLGSRLSARVPPGMALAALAVMALASPIWLSPVLALTLGWPLGARLGVTAGLLAPLGFLLGIPFPAGIRALSEGDLPAGLVPWAWAVNGAASVVAPVVAALLALWLGFSAVLWLGALCYAGAWLTGLARPKPPAPRRSPRR